MPMVLPHHVSWPHSDGAKPFVMTEPRAIVEVQGWFAGVLLLPLAARLMHAAFLHATSKKAEEMRVTPQNHSRAGMHFVKAIVLIEVMLLAWPMTVPLMYGLFNWDSLAWILVHLHWRLFMWGVAVLSSVMVFELILRPPRFWRFLTHGCMLGVLCLVSGIPWLSSYDLMLFCAGALLHVSFVVCKCVEFFALSWFFMRPGDPRGRRTLRATAVFSAACAVVGHGFVLLFYCAALPLFTAWLPLLVLILLQVGLVCDNVHSGYYCWTLADRTQKRLEEEKVEATNSLGITGVDSFGLGASAEVRPRPSLALSFGPMDSETVKPRMSLH